MSAHERIESVVLELSVFAGLTPPQATAVADICAVRQLQAGEELFAARAPSKALYLLMTGSVSVTIGDPGPDLGVIVARETVGEVSLITGQPHSATVIALEPSDVAVLLREDLERLVDAEPRIGMVLYRNLALGLDRKLRRIDSALADWR